MNFTDYKTREDWLAARTTFIGASETAAVFGQGYANQSPLTVWASKVHPEAPTDDETPIRLTIGTQMQPVIVGLARANMGLELEPAAEFGVYRHIEYPFIGATLDGWWTNESGIKVPAEIKNVSNMNKAEWNDGGAPLKFLIQCHQQMLCTDTRQCKLIGFIGSEERKLGLVLHMLNTGGTDGYNVDGMLVERTIDFDDELGEMIIAHLCKFWELVQTKTPSEIDGSDATKDVLNRLHPNDNGDAIELDDKWDERYERRAELAEKIKELTEEKQEIENRARLAIGDNTFADLPSGRRISWKTQDRKGYYVQPSTMRVMRWK